MNQCVGNTLCETPGVIWVFKTCYLKMIADRILQEHHICQSHLTDKDSGGSEE